MYKAWHWPKNWLPKGYRQFWCKLIGFSLLGHCVMLFFGFFYHSEKNLKLTVFSQTRSVEIKVVPWRKKILQAQKTLNPRSTVGSKKVATGQAAVIKKAPDKKLTLPKQISKPKKTKIVPKKVVPQKADLKKQVMATPAKPFEPEKKIEPPVVAKSDLVPAQLDPVLNEPIYIGRHDLRDLQIAQELEAVIVKNWQPPLGFDADTECTVELMVDSDGKVKNFVIKKSSNIAVYDMSVKRIFAQIVMPVAVRNKTLTIVFKQ